MSTANLSMILGAQWGDEGKGKLVDILSEDFDVVARATGGANAGHTVYVNIDGETRKFVFHLLPSGVLREGVTSVIGNGCVLHLETVLKELKNLSDQGLNVDDRLKISSRASLLFDYHKIIDGWQEDSKGDQKVGTTRRGIGPCYADKINRRGLRMCDLEDWDSFVEMYKANLAWHQKVYGFEYDEDTELAGIKESKDRLLGMMVDGTVYLNGALESGKRVLVEGANAALLDIDHGTYPYVTSSNPTIGGVFTGTGMNARYLKDVIGIIKAYMTRVGAGPFPTELHDDLGDQIREAGGEYGSTTGRPRRCGWFDVPLTRYSIMLNGYTSLNLTKLDVLDDLDEIKVCVGYTLNGEKLDRFPARLENLAKVEVEYETLPGWNQKLNDVTSWDQLPENAKNYVLRLEELLGCPIKYIGVGQRRDQLITKA
jgi:adenylosuccinate synthase